MERMNERGAQPLVTVSTAAEAFVQREVAYLRAWGHAVWVRRCLQMDSTQDGKVSFGYFLALDDQPGCAFEPDYRGSIEDLVPEGFDDFRLYIGGNDVEEFPSDGGEPPEEPASPLPAPMTAQDGTTLRFVTRIDSTEAARTWLSRPEAYLRCDECALNNETVLVGDPEQECDCGALARNEDGALEWGEPYRFTFPTVYLAE